MNFSEQDLQYVTSVEEILWGVLLVAVTLVIHGFGMVSTLRASGALKARFQHPPSFSRGMAIIILATGLMIMVHLLEVVVWAGFFVWKGAMPNQSLAFYFALMDYTTLGSNFNLPPQWRLLEGMIGIAGMMSFAWSTGILLTLAQTFQDEQLDILKRRRANRTGVASAAHAREPDHPVPPA